MISPTSLQMEKEKKMKIKILVCCHKPDKWLADDMYMPIQCGKAISRIDLGIQGDNAGDNISIKNPNYCELTAMYWAWKNLKNIDYIGLCHYRRYFLKYNDSLLHIPMYKVLSLNAIKDIILKASDIKKCLSKYDVVLPSSIIRPYNLRTEYSYMLNSIDYKILKNVIKEMYPEYIPAFEKIMYYGNRYSAFNMMIMKWELFSDYCKWLFSILFELEKKCNIENYIGYYIRIYGYMSERLLNVYILHNNLKIKRYSVGFIDNNKENICQRYIKEILKKFLFNISFIINKPRHSEQLDI